MGLYVGLMSGTSMDGIDAALVAIDGEECRVLAARTCRWDPRIKAGITRLLDHPDACALDEIATLDVAVAREFAAATLELLESAGTALAAVAGIGCHGQTLRHRPDGPVPFTWQIGDPNVIAELTGRPVVGDFRRRDLAAGGQGAPLVPAFHAQVFASATEDRVIVNIGGIANITVLVRGRPVTGFDTGPGNRLMDAWMLRHRHREVDHNGEWARSGTADAALLQTLLGEPYLALPAPKSTGRELFNLDWLDAQLGTAPRRPVDVQATLLEYTAATIATAVQQAAPAASVYLCGGGVHNAILVAALARRLAPQPVASTAQLGLDPDFVEATAFAWFAQRTLTGSTSSLPEVTGARGPRVLGGVFR
jgi:anhydro-N-acetylmuramic acid kinase